MCLVRDFHMRRLRSRKVFIVLDNVDSLDQFEYLCRDYGDLSNDSRLVITTRDRQLLNDRVDMIHEVKPWKDSESLELFSLAAFNGTTRIKFHSSKVFEHEANTMRMELRCLPKLPSLIKQLYVVNCASLVSISNLKTLASKMMGNAKHISFSNSLNLDGNAKHTSMQLGTSRYKDYMAKYRCHRPER
ncbi:unnamed protein product [Trifolium pratense]|uniref:Uncharacterized protein n=1 Tax=Trifolium pratense TaxID=57577 RepID=A0ACB0LRU6_TRIPR|nr:unnamed protein product [Trifolium pratense]